MKITCRHGFFIIRDEASWEIPRFVNIFGLPISSFRDFYTFDDIAEPAGYSLVGKKFLGGETIQAYEGEPWEIFRANDLVYDFNEGVVKSIETVKEKLFLANAGQFYVSNGLMVPGSLRSDGARLTDYTARFIWDSMSFRYSEVVCE